MSDFNEVKRKAKLYLGDRTKIIKSDKKYKKFMVLDPKTNNFVHFGDNRYEDFTKHKDIERRKNYLKRSKSINESKDKYNANNLSRNILW
jgi:hypothetical protein